MKISNVEELRDATLEIFSQLKNDKVDAAKAGVMAKLSENILSSARLQMEYAGHMKEIPNIKFLQDSHKSQGKIIEHKKLKHLDKK